MQNRVTFWREPTSGCLTGRWGRDATHLQDTVLVEHTDVTCVEIDLTI